MRTIFLDTVGLIALWNKNDQWHMPALRSFSALQPDAIRLVTTPLVLLECANDAARKSYRAEVIRVRRNLLAAGDLYEPTADEVTQAWAEYEMGAASAAGVVDLVSIAVMRRLGLTEAFTNDRHFVTAGFTVLF